MQLLQQGILFAGARINEDRLAAERLRNILTVYILVQNNCPLAAGLRHAVIGDDDHIEILAADCFQLCEKKPDRLIDRLQSRFDFSGVGTKPMAGLVDVAKIKRQELRPRFLWQRKPIDNLRDALFVGQAQAAVVAP